MSNKFANVCSFICSSRTGIRGALGSFVHRDCHIFCLYQLLQNPSGHQSAKYWSLLDVTQRRVAWKLELAEHKYLIAPWKKEVFLSRL